MLSSILNSFHNVLIASAAADVPFETLTNLSFGRVGIVFQQIIGGHNHAWGAETALQAMLLPESFLDRVEASFWCKPFNCGDFRAISLNSQNGTGFDRCTIKENGTGPTLRGIATNVSTCEV